MQKQRLRQKNEKKSKIDQHNSRVDDSQTLKKVLSFVNVDEIRYIDKKKNCRVN